MRPSRASPPLVVLVVLAASSANAQPGADVDDRARATARALGQDGVNDFMHDRYVEAAEKLDRAYAIVHIHTLGPWSARARVKLGRLVEAAERYLEVARMPVTQGDPAKQEAARASAASE